MARDAVANVVMGLMNCGYDPRKVGDDAWESRCRAHRSADHALAIGRNTFNHVTLEYRSAHNCTHSRIVKALGLTNEHVYAETVDGWVRRLGLVPVQSTSLLTTSVSRIGEPRRTDREGCRRRLPFRVDRRANGARTASRNGARLLLAWPKVDASEPPLTRCRQRKTELTPFLRPVQMGASASMAWASIRLAPSRRTSVRTSWPLGNGTMSIPVVD
jgi:hypothetical protein